MQIAPNAEHGPCFIWNWLFNGCHAGIANCFWRYAWMLLQMWQIAIDLLRQQWRTDCTYRWFHG